MYSTENKVGIKYGFPLIFGYFSLLKGQTALWLFIQH